MCENSLGKTNDVPKSIHTSLGSSLEKNEDLETAEEAITTDSEEYISEPLR